MTTPTDTTTQTVTTEASAPAPAAKPPFIDRTDDTFPPRPSQLVNRVPFSAPATPAPAVKPQTAPTAPAPEADDDVPAKYKGKTRKQVAEMHQNLESEKGRLANEVGQLRKTVDELLAASIKGNDSDARPTKKKREPVTSDTLLTDPDKTITDTAKEAVKEDLDKTSDRLSRLEYKAEEKAFMGDFPEASDLIGTEEFVSWVQASPIRLRLAAAAHQGSFDAARELFGLRREVDSARKPKEEVAKVDQTEAVKDATTVKPANAAANRASNGQFKPKGETVKRSYIRNLFIKNRTEYTRRMAQGGDLHAAYAEKRVID